MKRITTALALTAALVGAQASALSCMRPDVARSFQWAAEADESYVVLLGQFDFDAPRQSNSDRNAPKTASVPAQFNGQSLGANGFQANAPLDVTLEFSCAGPWCGSLPDTGEDILAFVERGPDGYVLTVGPCYGTAFVSPSESDVQRVEACMRGDGCEEGPMTR